jgi:hypothetical protein
MEGQVYLCSWKRAKGRFRVWLQSDRRVAAEAATFREASEALWSEIVRAFNDGEAVLEYQPPPRPEPATRRFLDPHLVSVIGNMRARLVNPDEMFTEGLCPQCREPRGQRTKAPALLEDLESVYEGGFTKPARIVFFSDRFLALLTDAERGQFDWRPVYRTDRGRKAFFEMIAPPEVPLVAVASLDFRRPWVCDTCGRRSALRYYQPDFDIYEFVCRFDLPRPLPSCFTIGFDYTASLVFLRERWAELAGHPGTRGLASNNVGVVDEAECVRDLPRVPLSTLTPLRP